MYSRVARLEPMVEAHIVECLQLHISVTCEYMSK